MRKQLHRMIPLHNDDRLDRLRSRREATALLPTWLSLPVVGIARFSCWSHAVKGMCSLSPSSPTSTMVKSSSLFLNCPCSETGSAYNSTAIGLDQLSFSGGVWWRYWVVCVRLTIPNFSPVGVGCSFDIRYFLHRASRRLNPKFPKIRSSVGAPVVWDYSSAKGYGLREPRPWGILLLPHRGD